MSVVSDLYDQPYSIAVVTSTTISMVLYLLSVPLVHRAISRDGLLHVATLDLDPIGLQAWGGKLLHNT
jgi:hypothetical protein